MGLGVMMFSGFVGFLAATFSGLMLGLTFLQSFGVYFGVGLAVAMTLFTVRAVWCSAAQRLA